VTYLGGGFYFFQGRIELAVPGRKEGGREGGREGGGVKNDEWIKDPAREEEGGREGGREGGKAGTYRML